LQSQQTGVWTGSRPSAAEGGGAARASLEPGRSLVYVNTVAPRRIGLSCHRRSRLIIRKLDTSVGVSGPHDFAVRISAARLATPSRPSHPAPNVRDDAYAPLVSARRGKESPISEKTKAKYFYAKDWTTQITLKCFMKSCFWRTQFCGIFVSQRGYRGQNPNDLRQLGKSLDGLVTTMGIVSV